MLRAYDKATGDEVGAVYMTAPQTGSPMTYEVEGEQLGAFARLPRPKNNAELPAIDADRERKLRALGYLR